MNTPKDAAKTYYKEANMLLKSRGVKYKFLTPKQWYKLNKQSAIGDWSGFYQAYLNNVVNQVCC